MKLVRRQLGLIVVGCVILSFALFRLVEALHCVTSVLGILYGVIMFVLESVLGHYIAILCLPIYFVALIVQDSLLRWAFLIPTVLGVVLAAYFRRQHKNGVLG
jgi:hypothetical protein